MSIATLYTATDTLWLEPDEQVQVEDAQVFQCDLSIPAAKYVHVVLIYNGCVAKTDFGLEEKLEHLWYQAIVYKVSMLLRALLNLVCIHCAPFVCSNLIRVHVREDVSLISATIHIELIEMSHESMVRSG